MKREKENRLQPGVTIKRLLKIFLPAMLLIGLAALYLGHVEFQKHKQEHQREEYEAVRAGTHSVTGSIQKHSGMLTYWGNRQQEKILQNPNDKALLESLAKDWANFVKTQPVYEKIYWFDEHGREKLHVAYAESAPKIRINSQRIARSYRRFISNSLKLTSRSLLVSPFELDIESSRPGQTPHPVIYFGIPLIDAKGKRHGVIMVNYAAKFLLEQFVKDVAVQDKESNNVWLLNQEGFWLKGSNPSDEFGFMHGQNELSVSKIYPQAWEKIANSDNGQFQTKEGLWTFSTADPFSVIHKQHATLANLLVSTGGEKYQWKVVSFLPIAEYNAAVRALNIRLVTGACGLMVLFMLFSWWILKARIAKENNQARLQTLLDNIPDLVWLKDKHGVYLDYNPAFQKFFRLDAQPAIGKTDYDILPEKIAKQFYAGDQETISSGAPLSFEDVIDDESKESATYLETVKVPIKTESNDLIGVLGIARDITARKQAEELIWLQANFDSLTTLPNRPMFREKLKQAIKNARRRKISLALLFLDLDEFKDVNDTLGHDTGDILLKEVALRLATCVRESDIVARLGGDEFVVLLGELNDPPEVRRVAQKILQAFTKPFNLGDREVHVSTSIGIAIYPQDASSGEDLLKKADQAMYAAKNIGRNKFHYFKPEMQDKAQQRMKTVSDLHAALVDLPFLLHYQPIIELQTGEVSKAEALIRWQHPALGIITPSQFIHIAEETGMIGDISDWAFRQITQQTKIWRDRLHPDFQTSFNVSPVQFRPGDIFLKSWVDHFKQIHLPGSSVVIEITEGLLLDNHPSAANRFIALRDAGIQVALDDFGTGFSSLAYLKKFHIDYLKIDKSFIQNLAEDENDMALCEAIIVMAHKLGIKVIAEGVETQRQLDFLRSVACDFAQGFLFSKPLPAQELETLLTTFSHKTYWED